MGKKRKVRTRAEESRGKREQRRKTEKRTGAEGGEEKKKERVSGNREKGALELTDRKEQF